MHPLILGAGLWAVATLAVAAPARCPAPGAAVVEHFVDAGCAACWAAAVPVPAGAWRFDWIVPGADDAPLSAAALPDATERLQRLGGAPPGPRDQPAHQPFHQPAHPPVGLALTVGAGPAWQGYFGLHFNLRARATAALPAGASGWVALVELLPPGSEANDGPRALVRSVAGPLPLDGAARTRGITHLRALRWPTGAKPERLQARAWVEAADGRLLAVAAARCP